MSAEGKNTSGSYDINYSEISDMKKKLKREAFYSLSFLLSNLADFFKFVFFYDFDFATVDGNQFFGCKI